MYKRFLCNVSFLLIIYFIILFIIIYSIFPSPADAAVFYDGVDPSPGVPQVGDVAVKNGVMYEITGGTSYRDDNDFFSSALNKAVFFVGDTLIIYSADDNAYEDSSDQRIWRRACHSEYYPSSYQQAVDGDGDGSYDPFDPFPDTATGDDDIYNVSCYTNSTSGESLGCWWYFVDSDTGEHQSVLSGDLTWADIEEKNNNWLNSDLEVSSPDFSWQDYLDSQANFQDAGVSESEMETVFNEQNYMDYVDNTPEPITYDSDIETNPSPASNGTDNAHLAQIESNTGAALSNQNEMTGYLKSMEAQLRKGFEVDVPGYGGPSASAIGDAVANASSGSADGNYTGPSAEEIGNATGRSVLGTGEAPADYTEMMPDNPGHGHGTQDYNSTLGYFDGKLSEWYDGFADHPQVNAWFNNTGIKYTNPSPVLCIGEMQVFSKTMPETCTDFSDWQTPLQTIGSILYSVVAIWWGLWVFRRGD